MTEPTAREKLKRQVARLPSVAGVYLFRDDQRRVLYVGKAKSLRSRVRSYLRADRDPSPKLRDLARHIATVETFVLDSESEALLLEWNLIREYRPRFNIQADSTGGAIAIEANVPAATISELANRGHAIDAVDGLARAQFGRGQIIRRDSNGALWAGSDPRSDGCAMSL